MRARRILALFSFVSLAYSFSCSDVEKEFKKFIKNYKVKDASINSYTCTEDKNKNVVTLKIPYSFQIKEIPDFIFKITSLRELQFSDGNLLTIPKEIKKLINLRKLSLDDNLITDFPSDIGVLDNLEELILSRNKISSIPKEIDKMLKKLKKLDLHSNKISSIPDELYSLDLNLLDISENPIKTTTKTYTNIKSSSVSSKVKRCADVRREIKNNNKLYEAGRSEYHISTYKCSEVNNEVVSLKITNSLHLKEIPKFVFELTALKEFELSDANLSRIPDEFKKLVNLKKLSLEDNLITAFPKDVSVLKSIEELNLSRNKISFIPKEINVLKNLKVLILRKNSISSIPKELDALKLKQFDINDNKVKITKEQKNTSTTTTTTTTTVIKSCADVKREIKNNNKLYKEGRSDYIISSYKCSEVNHNVVSLKITNSLHIKEIPKFVFELTSLKEFELTDANLTKIPNELKKLVNLKKLNLEDNLITAFPKDVSVLKNIEELNLSRNKISSIPKEVNVLKKVKVLNLRKNNISSIPKELTDLKIKELDTSGNPIKTK